MLIGVISDTHDNLPMIDKAVELLNRKEVNLVLHAGDYVSPFVIPRFKALKGRLIGVLGNNDGDHEMLKQQFRESGNCELRSRFAAIEAEGFTIALTHGNETELLNALVSHGTFDAVVHGHSHFSTTRADHTIVLNPGEVCGYLTGISTLALLNTRLRTAEIVRI